jgi:GT2 family glycosyltransferase
MISNVRFTGSPYNITGGYAGIRYPLPSVQSRLAIDRKLGKPYNRHAVPAETYPSVAVIVLTWNGKALTLACLDSLAGVQWPNLEVVIVDNASSDGTVEAIRAGFGDRFTVLVNEANLGFAGGNNVGIGHALRAGRDYVLLLNNDTTVDPDCIAALVDVFREHPGTGIAGPKIYYADPPDRIWYAGGVLALARGTARHVGIRETDHGQFDTPGETDYVTGCALMASRAVFESVGMLDDSYRAYYEDADFCMRARRAGFSIRYTPRGRVWHKISSSTGGQVSRRKIIQKFKSTVKFFRRYASPHHWITIPFFFTADVIRIIAMIVTGRIKDSGGGEPA